MAFFVRKLAHPPRNLLVARTDRIGDFILTLPVFELWHRHGIPFTVLCREMVLPSLAHNPHVSRIQVVDGNPAEIGAKITAADYDALLVLVNDPVMRGLLPQLRSIPVRIGPLSKPSAFWEYTHPVVQKRSQSVRNEAEYNLELLQIFGIDDEPVRPRLYLTEAEQFDFKQDLLKRLKRTTLPLPLAILHQGMGGSALNWPARHYRELLRLMLTAGWHVILTGFGSREEEENRQLTADLAAEMPVDRLTDMSGRFSLRELALLIAAADVFIGPSTGPTHVANAVGTPLISFYPPIRVQSSLRWQPFLADSVILSPEVSCGQKYKCLGAACRFFDCMARITPEAVFEQLATLTVKSA